MVRERLFADRTYYVRSGGNNNCNGLTDADGSSGECAFATIQKGLDVAYGTLDLGGFTVVIQARTATYTTPLVVNTPQVGAGLVSIRGDNATPSNVVISVTSAQAVTVTNGAKLDVRDLKVQTTTGGSGLYVERAGILLFRNIDFGTVANAHIHSTDGGNLIAEGNYAVTGNAGRHWLCGGPSTLRVAGRTITISNSPTFTNWAEALIVCSLVAAANTYTNGGTVTATRYSVTLNAVLFTNGASTGLPGTGGTTATGGQVN